MEIPWKCGWCRKSGKIELAPSESWAEKVLDRLVNAHVTVSPACTSVEGFLIQVVRLIDRSVVDAAQ